MHTALYLLSCVLFLSLFSNFSKCHFLMTHFAFLVVLLPSVFISIYFIAQARLTSEIRSDYAITHMYLYNLMSCDNLEHSVFLLIAAQVLMARVCTHLYS